MEYKLLAPRQENLSYIEQVFSNRGMNINDISHYLQTSEEDIINPNTILNIHKGVQMLIKHIFNQDKTLIQIDSDVDGYTSAAALYNYLYYLFPTYVTNDLIYRIHDGKQHGILIDTIPKDVKFVIVPDAGSSDYEQHAWLKEHGIDVLVIDHHETDKISENACIINNQIGEYKNKTLSGVGMVYKVCQYIDNLLGVNYANKIIDLTALGIVSDMMDLRNFETREIITKGLHYIENPFFCAFVEKQSRSLKGQVTPYGVAFFITPYINATIRVGTSEEKLLLFEAMLNSKAYDEIPSTKRGCKGEIETRVEQACRNCQNIKSRQTRLKDTSLEIIKKIIEKENLQNNPMIIVQLENSVDENLTGLIANQIMDEYKKPVLLLNKYIEVNSETGEVTKFAWRGSGRNFTFSKLTNLRELLNNSNLVEYAQGHANAFGISILNENFEQFKQYVYTQLSDFDCSPCYYVDFILNSSAVSSEIISSIGNLNYVWGQGLPEPKLAIENIYITKNNIALMGTDKNTPTLKITLSNNISLIKFKSSYEEYNKLCSEQGCVIINAIGICQMNEWNGVTSPQIIIEDYEIVNKSAYYF